MSSAGSVVQVCDYCERRSLFSVVLICFVHTFEVVKDAVAFGSENELTSLVALQCVGW